MNVLGLFDGISCGQVALRNLGITDLNYYSSEIDKYAITVTQRNFPETIQLGNVYDIDYSKLPKIDLVLGGSPCTHWSIAKRNRETTSSGIGFDLFMQYVKAVRILKPKYFLYENNFSIHKDIKDAISLELQVEPIVINSALVSAQQRKNGGGKGAKTGLYKIDLPDGDYFVRKLTPVECERLQNLADGYTDGISKVQRYKCIGNGWTVGVIEHILKNMEG